MGSIQRIWKFIERRAFPGRYLAEELRVGRIASEQVIGLWNDGWKPFIAGNEGEQCLHRLIASPFFLGYLYAWCDIMTPLFGGERGGNGCIDSFLAAVNEIFPTGIAEETFFRAERLLHAGDEKFAAGAKIGAQDYNRFAVNRDGDRLPIGLLSLAKLVSSPDA